MRRAWITGNSRVSSYRLDTGTIAVTITLKQAKGGYTVAAAAVVS